MAETIDDINTGVDSKMKLYVFHLSDKTQLTFNKKQFGFELIGIY